MVYDKFMFSEEYDRMRNIKYLIKYIPELEYAEALLSKGELFMRSADHFRRLEIQDKDVVSGDVREGIVFDSVFVGLSYPIYCMYSVFEENVIDIDDIKHVMINTEFVEKFINPQKGFIVISEYVSFSSKLHPENFNGYKVKYGLVTYGAASKELNAAILREGNGDSLFIKGSNYEYQNEFRVLLFKNLDKKTTIDDKSNETIMLGYKEHIEHLGSLKEFSKIYDTANIKHIPEYGYCLAIDRI